MIQTILQVLIITANFFCLVAFGIDKFNSKKGRYRIPESKLLLLALFAPFGALIGMLLFRHKTRKIKFLLVPVFAVLQAILLTYYFVPLFGFGLFF